MENTTVDQPADDSQNIIRDIQIENEPLRKLEVEKLTHRMSVLEARVFTIDR